MYKVYTERIVYRALNIKANELIIKRYFSQCDSEMPDAVRLMQV